MAKSKAKKAAKKCVNCGKNCSKVVVKKGKAFCCDACSKVYGSKKPGLCEFC